MTTGAASTDALQALALERARAEAAEWRGVLAHRDREVARIDASDASPLRRLVERSAIALDIGQAVGLSEGQVVARIAAAQRLRDHAPTVWAAFGEGRLDAHRVREVATTLGQLERPASRERLDKRVVAYAATHTVAELRSWLRRFVARVEADLATERAEGARRDRRVEVVHTEDSMAWVNAYLPSPLAAAIDQRLDRVARAMAADDAAAPDAEERTLAQRRADLLVAWATRSESVEPAAPVVDLAVTIDAGVLAGEPGHVEAADGSWTAPAAWVLEALDPDTTFWHRILLAPGGHDVLSHHYLGRFAADVLARAVTFRDRTCRAPGCRVPARRCDLDHREPWPAGPTAGDNLWALCRRHHAMKGHRVLQWVLPSGRVVDA